MKPLVCVITLRIMIIALSTIIIFNINLSQQIALADSVTATIPIILDDDGSQDGMIAWAYMLANPKFEVKALTISQGVAHPNIFFDYVERMLKRLKIRDIPVGIGRTHPLEGNNQFPSFIREASDSFWSPFVTLPDTSLTIERHNAAELIVKTVKNSPQPVAILATGTLTNLAEALRIEPNIIDNISVVQIMGGAVFVPGNLTILPYPPFSTNKVAEFNIWADPIAAQEIFDLGSQGLKLQLTPLDATNKIQFTRETQKAWIETGTPESLLAAEFLDFALTIIESDHDPNPIWDLVAALSLSESNFSVLKLLHLEIDTTSKPGETQGQTKVVSDLSPNILVDLTPSFDNLSYNSGEIFMALTQHN